MSLALDLLKIQVFGCLLRVSVLVSPRFAVDGVVALAGVILREIELLGSIILNLLITIVEYTKLLGLRPSAFINPFVDKIIAGLFILTER